MMIPKMSCIRILLFSTTLLVNLYLVHLLELQTPTTNNETITTTALTNISSNTLVNSSSSSLSNSTTTTTGSINLPQNATNTNQNQTNAPNQTKTNEEIEFDRFRNSIYFLPPYEEGLKSIPKEHKEYINHVVDRDMDFFIEILNEAIEKRNKFAPSVSLMWKYASKLVSNCIKNRQGELRISPRKEMSPGFFSMAADLMEKSLKLSKEIRKEKGYTKNNIDVAQFGERVKKALNYVAQTIQSSPLAHYLKWDELQLYKNEATPKGVLEESSDLVAIFSAMGYDNCLFVAKRIVNLLRFFSRGRIPSETEV